MILKYFFSVSLGVFSLATKVERKKVPGFIKKFNKFLGLPSKSNRILDILKISGIEEKINNNKGNIEKNMADIAEYHPQTSKLNKMCKSIWQNVYTNKMYIKKIQSTKHYINSDLITTITCFSASTVITTASSTTTTVSSTTTTASTTLGT